MKNYFSWGNAMGNMIPSYHTDVVNKDGISLLACILMDDGGLPYLETLPWLNEGIDKIASIKKKEIDFYDWSRETWGAELTLGEVKIYSLHDEDYFQLLSLDEFEKALVAWKNFIQSTPEVGLKVNIEI